jgi:sugar phosphate isomerase/epimerase
MSVESSISRRRFIGAGAGVAAAAAAGPLVLAQRSTAAEPAEGCPPEIPPGLLKKERIGIQLYTVRDQVSSLGFQKVFETLAWQGYKEIEFAGYTQGNVGPITPQEIRQLLDDNGLDGVASHVGLNTSNIQAQLDIAQILGLEYIGIASSSASAPSLSAWQAVADNYNTLGAAAKERGIKFYFHNHNSEFGFIYDSPGTRIYDVLLAETDPELVFFEMDIFWAYVGQYQYGRAPLPTFEPLDYVTAQPERFPLFHVKDGKRNQLSQNGYDMVDVGQGHIDFKSFFCALPDLENRHFLMEHDGASGGTKGSLGSAHASFLWMRYGLNECPAEA